MPEEKQTKPQDTESSSEDVEALFGPGKEPSEQREDVGGREVESTPEEREAPGSKKSPESEETQEEQVEKTRTDRLQEQQENVEQRKQRRKRDRLYEVVKNAFIKSVKEDIYDNADVFNHLSKKDRLRVKQEFGKEATEAANDILKMIKDNRLSYKRAYKRIDEWLQTTRKNDPEISKFYLLQESKKLTDEVRDIAEERQRSTESDLDLAA